MKQGLDQQIACKPAGRRRGFHQLPRRPARSMPGGRRGFTLEIKDMGRFDKAIRPRHAFGAHPLRKIGGRGCMAKMPMKWGFIDCQ
jgi:hypothetical protein